MLSLTKAFVTLAQISLNPVPSSSIYGFPPSQVRGFSVASLSDSSIAFQGVEGATKNSAPAWEIFAGFPVRVVCNTRTKYPTGYKPC